MSVLSKKKITSVLTRYTALKACLNVGFQRQDCTLQQLLDLVPALNVLGLSRVVSTITALNSHDLTDSGVYQQHTEALKHYDWQTGLTVEAERRIAMDAANLLGCYDAADAIRRFDLTA